MLSQVAAGMEYLHAKDGSSVWLLAYGASTADHRTYVCTASGSGVRFERQVVSDFAQQHFVRGNAYFYTLPLTSTGQTRQMNVVGYLPEFERSPTNESARDTPHQTYTLHHFAASVTVPAF